MAPEKLTRTSYRDEDGDPRDGATALAESRRDMEEQLQPLLRVHASTLHGPGVATGLAVTATTGATTITVGPGVAVDPLGHHLSVADKGHVLLGTNPEPVKVTTAGAVLDLTTLTPAPAAGPHHLTLTFTETFDTIAHAQSGGTIFELDHTPRLALHPATTPTSHPAVVLARVTLAADTTVTDLDPGDRQACPTPTGDLTVHQPHVTPDLTKRTVDERVAGHLTAHPDGGLTLRSTHTHTDGPLTVHGTLTSNGDATVTKALTVGTDLTVGATLTATRVHSTGPLRVDGTATVTDVLTTAKALRVGLDPIAGVTIAPADTSPNAGFIRFGDGTGWRLHVGRAREGVTGPPNTGITGVLTTIQDNGNVGVGTAQPKARLSVTERGAPEIAGTAQSSVLRTSAGPLGAAVGSEVALSSFGLVVDNANNVSLGVRAIRVSTGPPGWPSVALGLGMDVDNTVRAGGAGLLLHHDARVEVRGKLQVGGGGQLGDLIVTNSAIVGPFAVGPAQGRLMATGNSAEICFAKRTLGTWPTNPQQGDRYVWYNQSGTAAMYTDVIGDLLRVNPDGNLSLRGSLSCFRVDQPLMFVYESGTTNPERPVIAHSPSFTNWGLSYRDTDDTFIFQGAGNPVMAVNLAGSVGVRTASPEVTFHVVGNRIRLTKQGTNQSLDMRADGAALDFESIGGALFINNNNNAVHIRNLQSGSSRELKQDIVELSDGEALALLQGLNTVTFEFTGDDSHTTQVGFIAEETPDLLTSTDKKAIKPFGVIALLGKVAQMQHRRISELSAELASLTERRTDDQER